MGGDGIINFSRRIKFLSSISLSKANTMRARYKKKNTKPINSVHLSILLLKLSRLLKRLLPRNFFLSAL